jgi:hypothetical protein
MKKHFLFALIFVVSSFCSMAQEQEHKNFSPGELSKIVVDQIEQKIKPSKNQKDSLNIIFMQFADDLQKYRAQENAKVFNYLVKTRDDKVKILLRDDAKYEKYLLFLEEMKKKQDLPQNPPQQQHHGGQYNPMGGGQGF